MECPLKVGLPENLLEGARMEGRGVVGWKGTEVHGKGHSGVEGSQWGGREMVVWVGRVRVWLGRTRIGKTTSL